jgi:hypothetical protein
MNNFIKSIIFPLILVNITFSANEWTFLGISIGQLLIWIIIILTFSVLYNSFSKIFAITLLLGIFGFKFFFLISNSFIFNVFGTFFIALQMIISGSILFGKDPFILYKQLSIFFFLCIFFMLAQKIGLHDIFYGWNAELFHENPIYTFDETKDIGKLFKNLTLYPTLFIEQSNLVYVMYQGRPTGLLYSNNVLSIFIIVYAAMTFSYQEKKKLSYSSFILPIVVVLSASTLVIIGYLIFLFKSKRKFFNLFIFISILFLHYLLFPGLTSLFLDYNKHLLSFSVRFYEIFNSFGFNNLTDTILNVNSNSKIKISENEGSYSLFGLLFKSSFRWVVLIILFLFLFYIKKQYYFFNTKIKPELKSQFDYRMLFYSILLSQLATIYLQAPSLQFILGVSIYPLLYKFIKKENQDHEINCKKL